MITELRRSAAQRRLTGLLRRAAADRGIVLDRSIAIRSTTDGLQLTSVYGRTCSPSTEEGIDEAAIAQAARHQAAVAHAKAWREELTSRGISENDAPDASRIMHPLALRLLLEEVGRGQGPSSWTNGRPGTGALCDVDWRRTQWGAIVITRILIDIGSPAMRCAFVRMPTDNRPAETEYSILQRLPDTVALATAGQQLLDIVGLPPSGEEDVDEAVGSLTIRAGAATERSTMLTLEPARWLPVTGNPAWRDWHDAHPYIE